MLIKHIDLRDFSYLQNKIFSIRFQKKIKFFLKMRYTKVFKTDLPQIQSDKGCYSNPYKVRSQFS